MALIRKQLLSVFNSETSLCTVAAYCLWCTMCVCMLVRVCGCVREFKCACVRTGLNESVYEHEIDFQQLLTRSVLDID